MIRQINREEVREAFLLANAVYPPALHEALANFEQKQRIFPEGFLGYFDEVGFAGYVVGHPWKGEEPVPLNYRLIALPENPDRFYFHDIVVSPRAKGRGYGKALIETLIQKAQGRGFGKFMGVAVTDAGRKLLEHFGFTAVERVTYTSGVTGFKMSKETEAKTT